MKIAIAGAGIAGLSAARVLAEAGHEVTLFDKGRGPGGRLSTRRAQTPLGEVSFDHGAQYFTARSETFRDEVVRLREAGAVARWQPRLADIRRTQEGWTLGIRPLDQETDALFAGTPSMSAVVKAMAEGLDVRWGRRVVAVEPGDDGKRLRFEDGAEAGPFDKVICAMPAEQAADFLAGASEGLAAEAAAARSAPCWAAMLAFEARVRTGWDAAKVSGSPVRWAARNSSKPGRGEAESWVIHAGADWSAEHVEMAPEEALAALVTEFRAMTGAPAPLHAAAHRWRYAMITKAGETAFGWDPAAEIAAVGDWRIGPRVEAAWLSGHACGQFLAGSI